jgi:RND family efflux transporter MFP subunit
MNVNRLIHLTFSFVFLLLISCNTVEENNAEKQTENIKVTPQKVTVSVLKTTDFSSQTISNGILNPSISAELFFETSGTLENIFFKNGDRIKKGEIVAVLQNKLQLLNIKKAEERVKAANNELSSLLLGFGGKQGDTTSVDNKLLQNLKSQSGYSMALLNLKSAQYEYSNTFLKAPFDGIISGIEKQNYNQILASKSFCTLINTDNFIANFTVIEQEFPTLKKGQKIKVFPIALETIFVDGKITEIDPIVDENGLIKIKAQVNNHSKTNSSLLAGMNIKVIIEKTKPNQLSVPKSALVLRSGKEVVFTLKNKKAKWNYVESSGENSTSYLISKGLKENDTIIIKGALNLAHDAMVEITNNR